MERRGYSTSGEKGKGEVAREYRLTLMLTLYKIYTIVLTERLREEMEGKGMLPMNQVGFRKGKRTMDNIFLLNYLINRQLEKKGGKHSSWI